MSESPFFMKGPEEMSPLNMATTRPVDRTINVSMEVNANITGVKRTPPPIPATTATMAMAVLKTNEPKIMYQIACALNTSFPVTLDRIPINT